MNVFPDIRQAEAAAIDRNPCNVWISELIIRQKGNIMPKTLKYKDIEQLLAEADELLQQIDPEIVEYMDEEKRAQFEKHAKSLKEIKSEVQQKIVKEGTPENTPYAEGMHEAIRDIMKAMKDLGTYLS